MSLDREFAVDIALVGTGVASLVAAQIFLRRGWSVLHLNPDHDFFIENSELPFDPSVALGPGKALSHGVLDSLRADRARQILEPEFPGSIEGWSREKGSEYFDPRAPFLRSRSWNWIGSPDHEADFLKLEEKGWHPQITEGVSAARRIPGFTYRGETPVTIRGLSLPKIADIDVNRYRNGVLEFVRSRMDANFLVTSASAIEPTPEGVRFYQAGVPRTVKLRQGLRIFRTPRLNLWCQSIGLEPSQESKIWEEWTLISRDPLDPSQLGFVGLSSVWAKYEGAPSGPIHELGVFSPVLEGEKVAGPASFARLGGLAQRVLNWDRFSVRDLKERRISSPPQTEPEFGALGKIRWMWGSDGALVGLVDRVVRFCSEEKE